MPLQSMGAHLWPPPPGSPLPGGHCLPSSLLLSLPPILRRGPIPHTLTKSHCHEDLCFLVPWPSVALAIGSPARRGDRWAPSPCPEGVVRMLEHRTRQGVVTCRGTRGASEAGSRGLPPNPPAQELGLTTMLPGLVGAPRRPRNPPTPPRRACPESAFSWKPKGLGMAATLRLSTLPAYCVDSETTWARGEAGLLSLVSLAAQC